MLYECLTGDRPFPGDSLESQAVGHMMTAPPRPSAIHAAVPAAFDAVIATGMAKDPAERYSTAVALARAARAAVEASTPSPPLQRKDGPDHSSPTLPSLPVFAPTQLRPLPTPSTTGSRDRSFGRKRALIVGATTILAAVAVIVGYTVMQQGGGSSVNEQSIVGTAESGVELLDRVKIGDCLYWPWGRPDQAEIVDCTREHRFEVVEAIDLSTLPGGEPGAAPPAPDRVQQISQERCDIAARQYLGEKYDPNSRFSISLLWSGDKAWSQSDERLVLCGLQLPGPNGGQQFAFRGKVADIDQSKVWPPGTCLGIDPVTKQPTDIPVDCSMPHAMEVTGHGQCRRAVPRRASTGRRAGRVRQERVHNDDRLVPRTETVARHHAHPDLQHDLAGQLDRRQPPGVL